MGERAGTLESEQTGCESLLSHVLGVPSKAKEHPHASWGCIVIRRMGDGTPEQSCEVERTELCPELRGTLCGEPL